MVAAVDVRGHHLVVGAIEKDLAKELDRLTFGYVAVRLHEGGVVAREEKIEVRREVLCDEGFVLG